MITGLVMDQAGAPISGVRVVASRHSRASRDRRNLGIGQEWQGTRPLADELTQQAVQLAAQRAGQRTTLTDDAGRFRIAEIGDGTYRLEAFKEGVEFKHAGADYGRHGGRLWRAGNTSARIIGTPTQSLRLDVRLENGSALDEARLEVRYEERDAFQPEFTQWRRGDAPPAGELEAPENPSPRARAQLLQAQGRPARTCLRVGLVRGLRPAAGPRPPRGAIAGSARRSGGGRG